VFFELRIGRLLPPAERGEVPPEAEDELDRLLLQLWQEEDKDAIDELIPRRVVHVSEITYLSPRSKGIAPAMLHGLEAEYGLKCRIREKFGNRISDIHKPTLLYPEYPVARYIQEVDAVLIGHPDFIFYWPKPPTFIPIEKKAGNNTLDKEDKLRVAHEQCAIYAVMLGSRYCGVQLERVTRKGDAYWTVTNTLYRLLDVKKVYDEIVKRVECVLRAREEGKSSYKNCMTTDLRKFLVHVKARTLVP